MSSEIRVVLVTAPREAAPALARSLVASGAAACVNVLGPIRSVYRWEGRVQDDPEHLLVVKTTAGLVPRLEARVRGLHDYDVPEVIALPIVAGSAPYLAWLRGSVEAGG